MRVLNKFGVCLLVAGIVSSANADISIDGDVLPMDQVDTYNVSVDQNGLNVTITTVNGNWDLLPSDFVPDPDPITLSFTADLTTVNQAELVNFTWTSTNAETCTATGGNAAWGLLGTVALNDTQEIRMNMLNPEAFVLSCEAVDKNTVSRAIVITVVDPTTTGGPGPGPDADCPAPEVTSDIVAWEDFWGGRVFPDQDVIQKDARIGRFDNLALEINTGNFNGFGVIKTIQLSDGNRNVAISECPGVFVQNVPSDCLQRQANGQTLFWSTDGSRSCNMEKNKTYYINITYVDVLNQSSSSTFCGSSSCRFYLSAGAAAQ